MKGPDLVDVMIIFEVMNVYYCVFFLSICSVLCFWHVSTYINKYINPVFSRIIII